MQELVKSLKGYRLGADGLTVNTDCSVTDAFRIVHKSNISAKVVRVCDACGRSGIGNETVYSCLKCEGIYDECTECHKSSRHYHKDSFVVDDNTAILAAVFCYDYLYHLRTGLGVLPLELLYKIVKPLHRYRAPQVPRTLNKETGSLCLFGLGIQARLFGEGCTCGRNNSTCYTHKRYVDTITLDYDAVPFQFVKPFEWRDWYSRTGGIAKIYTGCGGAIIVECPDYYIKE